MSLILEALKKSEQQRRLGEAPTLASPVVATRRRRSLLPVLAILVIAAAAVAWWLMRTSHAPSPSPTPSSPVASQGAKPAAAANVAPPSTVAVQGVKPAVATNPPPHAPPGSVADVRAQERAKLAAEGARRNGLRTEEEKRLAGIGTNTRATPPGTAPAAVKGAAPAVPTAPAPPVVQKPADSASPPAAASTQGNAVATAPPASGKTDARTPPPRADKTGDAVPSIWDLPFATRKDLPAIDLSMHVYSADPKQRFVVIKGERRVEGDEVGSDLILREIRQDGLVLDYKGQRFFFPRNGR